MRVGIDVSAAVYGTGVSDYVINLVNHLPQDILTLVGFSLRRQGDLKAIFPSSTTYPLPPTALHYLWNKFHVLNFENFAPGNIDVYHSSDWAQAPDSSVKVTTIHDMAPFIYPQEHDPKIVSVHKAKMNWVVKECTKIICVSKNTAFDLSDLFPQVKNKIEIISEALPTRFLHKPHKAPFSDYLVTLGARQPRKNIPNLIAAYLKYKNKLRLPEKLVIVGEVGSRVENPSIVYTGYVPDQMLSTLMAGAEAFVYPSLYEGFGLPILGAFHHRVPVACSNTSSLPEVAGTAASYFDPNSSEAIAHGISQAIKKRTEYIKSGTSQLAKFSWSKTAAETLKVYQSVT